LSLLERLHPTRLEPTADLYPFVRLALVVLAALVLDALIRLPATASFGSTQATIEAQAPRRNGAIVHGHVRSSSSREHRVAGTIRDGLISPGCGLEATSSERPQ
jgi:hypothetical protein